MMFPLKCYEQKDPEIESNIERFLKDFNIKKLSRRKPPSLCGIVKYYSKLLDHGDCFLTNDGRTIFVAHVYEEKEDVFKFLAEVGVNSFFTLPKLYSKNAFSWGMYLDENKKFWYKKHEVLK